jgi:hypothetical protein
MVNLADYDSEHLKIVEAFVHKTIACRNIIDKQMQIPEKSFRDEFLMEFKFIAQEYSNPSILKDFGLEEVVQEMLTWCKRLEWEKPVYNAQVVLKGGSKLLS